MANVHDAIDYVVTYLNGVPAMRLHKLLYYAQAWNLVREGVPLFDERIEAWINGPVVKDVYDFDCHRYTIYSCTDGNLSNLLECERRTINFVLMYYGVLDSQELKNLVMSEDPFVEARRGLDCWDRGDREITRESMIAYYSRIREYSKFCDHFRDG